RLQKDLTEAGFDVWLDTDRIGGGASCTVAIEEAIDRAQVVLALLTPGAYTSEMRRAEQLRSLRTGKCVIPALAANGPESCRFTSKASCAQISRPVARPASRHRSAQRRRSTPTLHGDAGYLHQRSAHGGELHRPAGSSPRAL